MIVDYDLEFLAEITGFFDARLDFLESGVFGGPDDDDAGRYDRAEYMTGLGFVACQTYQTAVISRFGLAPTDALALGPIHAASERPVVAIVHAAANLWKHGSEWRPPFGKPPARAAPTITILQSVKVDFQAAFPCHEALFALVGCARFEPLLALLTEWRDRARLVAF